MKKFIPCSRRRPEPERWVCLCPPDRRTDPRTKSALSEHHTDLAPFRTPVVTSTRTAR